jgi:hypothetical protein
LFLCNEWLAELEKPIASAIKSQVYYTMIINTAVNCLSLTVKGGNGAYWIKVHAQLGEVAAERVFFLFSKLHILPRVLWRWLAMLKKLCWSVWFLTCLWSSVIYRPSNPTYRFSMFFCRKSTLVGWTYWLECFCDDTFLYDTV